MLKALIFDMDGVLVDSMPFHAAAWKKAFLDMGMKIRMRIFMQLKVRILKMDFPCLFERPAKSLMNMILK